MNKFQSNVQWPTEVYKGPYGNGISTDKHRTREGAQAVCDALEKEGFGGGFMIEPIIKPIRTWVFELNMCDEFQKDFDALLARYKATFTQTPDGGVINFEGDTDDYYPS